MRPLLSWRAKKIIDSRVSVASNSLRNRNFHDVHRQRHSHDSYRHDSRAFHCPQLSHDSYRDALMLPPVNFLDKKVYSSSLIPSRRSLHAYPSRNNAPPPYQGNGGGMKTYQLETLV